MKWENIDWGFLLLAITFVMLVTYLICGCSSKLECGSCPSEGHGVCPFNPTDCCNGHVHDPRPK